MKKILLALMLVCGLAVGAKAGGNYTHDVSVLPANAAKTLRENFKATVSVIQIDKELGRVNEYEVILTDGTEITFNRDGSWDNVETRNSKSVPSAFIPASIATYVKTRHKGTRIVGIDKSHSGYEVELSNGMDIKFNKEGVFQRYDD